MRLKFDFTPTDLACPYSPDDPHYTVGGQADESFHLTASQEKAKVVFIQMLGIIRRQKHQATDMDRVVEAARDYIIERGLTT